MEKGHYYQRLFEALNLLSFSYEEQLKHFPAFVDVPSEILDTYEKAFLLLPQIIELKEINDIAIPNLLRIHNLISLIYNSDITDYSDQEFINLEEWKKIKILAIETLKLLN